MFDWLVRAIGGAVADVREKVVEEAWWGRSLSEGAALRANDSQDLGWREWKQAEPSHTPSGHDQGQDHGHGH